MPGTCFVCNPTCGKCRPPLKKAGFCPSCAGITLFDQAEVLSKKRLLCGTCKLDITDYVRPEPLICTFCGLPCAYPCGRAEEEPTLERGLCGWRTPLESRGRNPDPEP